MFLRFAISTSRFQAPPGGEQKGNAFDALCGKSSGGSIALPGTGGKGMGMFDQKFFDQPSFKAGIFYTALENPKRFYADLPQTFAQWSENVYDQNTGEVIDRAHDLHENGQYFAGKPYPSGKELVYRPEVHAWDGNSIGDSLNSTGVSGTDTADLRGILAAQISLTLHHEKIHAGHFVSYIDQLVDLANSPSFGPPKTIPLAASLNEPGRLVFESAYDAAMNVMIEFVKNSGRLETELQERDAALDSCTKSIDASGENLQQVSYQDQSYSCRTEDNNYWPRILSCMRLKLSDPNYQFEDWSN